MHTRTLIAVAAAALALGATAPAATAQSSGSLETGSLGSSAGEPAAGGANLGTVHGDRSTGCDAEWVSEASNARKADDSDLYKGRDGKPVDSPANGGFVSELSSGFESTGDLQMQHWISGNTYHWRTPVATKVPVEGAVLTLTFAPNTFTEAPTSEDVGASFFDPREKAFGMPEYTWKPAPAPTVAGDAATGFTLTYELGDLAENTGIGVHVSGPVAEGVDKQTGTATLTGTYPVGSASCTPVQGSIAGTPLGSLGGPLAAIGS